jgi:hypothetical protein
MEEKIITAKDYAMREGAASVKERIENICKKQGKGNETPIAGEPKGKPVNAEINFGQWIARCPDCKGAEAVDPNEPIFYCFSCGNFTNGGHPRPVNFPPEKERKAIEKEILKRPVKVGMGTHYIERLTMAIPVVMTKEGLLSRSWMPGETLDEIKRQNKTGGR